MADVPLMAGKSVLVTGGTGGIGKATAIGLAALGARVGITGRDPARTEAVAAGIRATPGSPAVDAFAADLSVQAGVRRLAAQVLDTYPRLDVLVNNAGVIGVARLSMKPPAQGAATPIYLASSPEVEGITGRYFVNRKPKTSSNVSYDTTAAARLWQASADLAGRTATT